MEDPLQSAQNSEQDHDPTPTDTSHVNGGDVIATDPSPPPPTTTTKNATEEEGIAASIGTISPGKLEVQLAEVKDEPMGSEDNDTESVSEDNQSQNPQNSENRPSKSPDSVRVSDVDEEEPHPKKQKRLSLLTPKAGHGPEIDGSAVASAVRNSTNGNGKKSGSSKKGKNNNVWTKSASRKGKKKGKSGNNNGSHNGPNAEDMVLITPAPRVPDKSDDSPDMGICLSKVYKAEKVELSEDRMSASSCKGYRMVRATRGVIEGAWYFEIKVVHLGESGHTRLGWSTEKGDLQAPVGYDPNSFGYRDIDGSKMHKALREKYADEGYMEGDVIGCYINLPGGSLYIPKPPQMVWFKGQRYLRAPDAKEDPPQIVPGSEISFFKNSICQGVAFKDLYGSRYYPAASMYTLPNQPNCVVKFNFGPDFDCFPQDFDGRPVPRPMAEVPYHGVDITLENGLSTEMEQ